MKKILITIALSPIVLVGISMDAFMLGMAIVVDNITALLTKKQSD